MLGKLEHLETNISRQHMSDDVNFKVKQLERHAGEAFWLGTRLTDLRCAKHVCSDRAHHIDCQWHS